MLTRKIEVDDALIQEARRLGKHNTKTEAVEAALEEYIRRRKQLEILELFGTIDYEAGYDYKKNRRRLMQHGRHCS